jgi:hypothetical protein
MISLPAGARVWLATGHTRPDVRKGFDGLALLVRLRLPQSIASVNSDLTIESTVFNLSV